ncbi:hypothetical protein [Streptomyces sp. NPDC047869]|uniref:hypothetical protein n=1 Tax=Streptomyces sp. NPDC047869 TaxID=3154709 RepID=UPI003455B125
MTVTVTGAARIQEFIIVSTPAVWRLTPTHFRAERERRPHLYLSSATHGIIS